MPATRSIYTSALTHLSQMYRGDFWSSRPIGYYYEAIQLDVSISGIYRLTSNSSMNTYGYLYNGSFNPYFAQTNLLKSDDDSGTNLQFSIRFLLEMSQAYILIFTTDPPNITGPFSIVATGPAPVGWSRIPITSEHTDI